MLLPAYQAWFCYPQKNLGFGSSMGVERLQSLRLSLLRRDIRIWSLGCLGAFSPEQSQKTREDSPLYTPNQ